jgi:hypothetical protein
MIRQRSWPVDEMPAVVVEFEAAAIYAEIMGSGGRP